MGSSNSSNRNGQRSPPAYPGGNAFGISNSSLSTNSFPVPPSYPPLHETLFFPVNLPQGLMFSYDNTYDFISERECSICLMEYQNGELLHKLPCNHIFHRGCIMVWNNRKTTCPICCRTMIQ
jgi:hypothetical protein